MLKFLNVVDEFTREALATDVARSIDADGVVTCLERLAAERGAPVYVRFDHGPEFIAQAVADWCRFRGTGTVFIDPGSPWQNAWIESLTAGCATSSSTAPSSTASSRLRSSPRPGGATPTTTDPTRPTAGSPRSSSSSAGSADSTYSSHNEWLTK
jgi:putative transposase